MSDIEWHESYCIPIVSTALACREGSNYRSLSLLGLQCLKRTSASSIGREKERQFDYMPQVRSVEGDP